MIWNIVSTEIYTGARGGFRGGVRPPKIRKAYMLYNVI